MAIPTRTMLIGSMLAGAAIAMAQAAIAASQQLDNHPAVAPGALSSSPGPCVDAKSQRRQLRQEEQRHSLASSRLSSALAAARSSRESSGAQAVSQIQQQIDAENKLHECRVQWIHQGCAKKPPPCQSGAWDQWLSQTLADVLHENPGGCGQSVKGPFNPQGSIVGCVRSFVPCRSITVQVAAEGDPKRQGYAPGSVVTFTLRESATGVPPRESPPLASPGSAIKLDVGLAGTAPYYVGMWPWGQASCAATRSASKCPKAPTPDAQACWAHLAPGKLCAEKGQFWNENGQVVELRGVNVAGTSKLPPFLPLPKSLHVSYPPPQEQAAHFFVDNTDVRQLDYLQASGFDVIRLLFVWEAYEPEPGQRDDSYLDMFSLIASEAWKRGIYTIIDFHQDAFGRWVDYGCGEGFPHWALGSGLLTFSPRNDGTCANWMAMAFTDLNGVQRAFADFYAGKAPENLRSRYIGLFGKLAQRFHDEPGVIGYDVLNEPFSYSFDNDLKELYRDVGGAIRASDPGAILFLEPDLMTDTNGKATLPAPFDTRINVAYAPHFYDSEIMGPKKYTGPATSQQAFASMRAFAAAWHAPLFLGEFGAPAVAVGAADYMRLLYNLLDGGLAGTQPVSGAQWVYSPAWTPDRYDGWDTENFSIVSDGGPRKQLFVPRAYALRVSGIPVKQVVGTNSIHLEWINAPEGTNQTVLFVPAAHPIAPADIRTEGEPSDRLDCHSAGPQQVVCTSDCWQKSFQVTISFTP